jgi:hypothetical protein
MTENPPDLNMLLEAVLSALRPAAAGQLLPAAVEAAPHCRGQFFAGRQLRLLPQLPPQQGRQYEGDAVPGSGSVH